MGHRLPSGLGGRGHSVDMLGVGEGEGQRIGINALLAKNRHYAHNQQKPAQVEAPDS